MEWFMLTQLNDHTWRITETLWTTIHSYLLIGNQRAALIDTCSGIGDIKGTVNQLTDLPVTVVNTHGHLDHTGGNGSFLDIRLHPGDAWLMANSMGMTNTEIQDSLRDMEVAGELPPDFVIDSFVPYRGVATTPLTEEILELGGLNLRIIHSPGHTPGHVCILDESNHNLFSGDLIYPGTLIFTHPGQDAEANQASLERVQALSPLKLWPSHGTLTLQRLGQVAAAFSALRKEGKLTRNSGLQRWQEIEIEV